MSERKDAEGLDAEERAFVKAFMLHRDPVRAYQDLYPEADANTCKRRGVSIGKRKAVEIAIASRSEVSVDAGERGQDGLLPLERDFVMAYMFCRHPAKALRFIRPSISEDKAREYGRQILRRPHVAAQVRAYEEEFWDRESMSANEVIGRLSGHGRAEMTDYVTIDEDGKPTFTPSDELTPQQRSAIKKFTIKERHMIDREGNTTIERNITFALNDPQRALELVGKHRGLWVDKVDIGFHPSEDSRSQLEDWLNRVNERALPQPSMLALPASTLDSMNELPQPQKAFAGRGDEREDEV